MRKELGTLKRGEVIGGLLYWPMYLYGSQVAAGLIAMALGVDLQQESALLPINLIFQLINLCVLLPIFHRFLKGQYHRLQQRGWQLFSDLGLGLALYFGLSFLATMAINFLITVTGADYVNQNQTAVEAGIRTVPWMGLAVVCLLAPITEEVLNRGLIFNWLYPASRILAYGVSMLVFSLIHVAASIHTQPALVTVANVIAYLPAGFVLAWVYERSESVWTSVMLHISINVISLLVQLRT